MTRENISATPFMMNFIIKEKSLKEPKYDPNTQLHQLVGTRKDNLANMTTTAIPNHRDTA